MKIISIICAVIALFDFLVVVSTMRISSQVSRFEEAERRKLDVKESRNNA